MPRARPLKNISIEELDALIGKLEEQLRHARYVRRAKIAGIASGKAPREPRAPYDEIRRFYQDYEEEHEGRVYGAVKAAASHFRVSTRTIHRALAGAGDG